MTGRSSGAGGSLARHMRSLFVAGSAAGLSDGELLERFEGREPPLSEAAFEALVDRHGAMVRRACRAMLGPGREADADDVFQAVFLLLARKASALRGRESVGPWLFETTCRVSRKARVTAARRSNHEARAAARAPASVGADGSDRVEDWSPLYEEIDRLPGPFRSAIVLCALEGRSTAEAAAVLGVAEGTVQSRLSRGRARLRDRLARRGYGVLSAVPIAPKGARATVGVPESLVEATIRSVSALSAGRLAAGEVPAAVLALVIGVSRRTLMHGMLSVGVLAAAIGPVAIGWVPGAAVDGPEEARAAASNTDEGVAPGEEAEGDLESLHLLFEGPDGTPVAGVEVWAIASIGVRSEHRADDAGRLVVPRRLGTQVVAVRPESEEEGRPRLVGFWQDFGRPQDGGTADRPASVAMRPVAESVTVRVEDEAGEAVAGAECLVVMVMDRGILGLGIRPLTGMARIGPEESRFLFGELEADREGLVRIPAPAGASLTVAASARHRAGKMATIHAGMAGPRSIVLHPAGGVTGTVVDATSGAPVAGVNVAVMTMDGPHPAMDRMYLKHAATGPDGRFEVPSMAPGVYVVKAAAMAEGSGMAQCDLVGIRVEPGEDAEVRLGLIPSRRVSGRVVSAIGGEPLAGVLVGARGQDGGTGFDWGLWGTITGASGAFSFDLPPGRYRFWARTEGPDEGLEVVVADDVDPGAIVLTAMPEPDPEGRQPLKGRKGMQAYGLAVAMEVVDSLASLSTRGYWGTKAGDREIRGRVVDEAGDPLVGVRVWPLEASERLEFVRHGTIRGVLRAGSATTDRDGEFRLARQPEGAVELGVWRGPSPARREVVAGGSREVEVVYPVRR